MLVGLAVWGAAIVLICCTVAIASSRRDLAERRALRAQSPRARARVRRRERGAPGGIAVNG